MLTETRPIRELLLILLKAGSDSLQVANATAIRSSAIRRDLPAELVAPLGQSRKRGKKA